MADSTTAEAILISTDTKQEQNLSPLAETRLSEKPIFDDPIAFIERFRRSEGYREAYREYFKGKTPASDVTEEEKIKVFEASEKARLSLLDLGENHIRFRYDSAYYPPETQQAIKEYMDFLRDIKKLQKPTDTYDAQNHTLSLDLLRSRYHNEAAFSLQKAGIVPNETLGRTVVQLIAIDYKLEIFGRVKESVAARAQRVLGTPPKKK